jgi:amino acid adenylation domain-containing protein/non-ribosomal peptide synthase protein (TIGR01720 family)
MISQDSQQIPAGADLGVPEDTLTEALFLPSFAQERLWFLDQLEPNSAVYNLRYALRMRGTLNVQALGHSLQLVIERHEALRTTFTPVEGHPLQAIAPHLELALPLTDLSTLPGAAREQHLHHLIQQASELPFDLARGPLVRAHLLRLAPREHVLVVTFHHIITDRWSNAIFWHDLSACYTALTSGRPVALPELPLQYADYAAWQREWLQGARLERLLSYWRQQLADAPPLLDLPTDHPRPAQASYRGTRYFFQLDRAVHEGLRALSGREGATLFMTLLAAFQVLLWRSSGQDDLVVGTPVAGRTRVELEGLMGLFVNTLVLRTHLEGNPTFRQLLARVREVCLGAYEHQDLPFEQLVEALNPERSQGYSPLFQVFFVLQNTPGDGIHMPGLEGELLPIESEATKFDLILGFWEEAGGFYGDFEYNTDLFEEETIARLTRHYQTLLESILADPDQPISRLPMLASEEQQQLLASGNGPTVDYSAVTSVPQLFEGQATRTPDAIALVWRDEHITFAELDRRANQLAHYLQRLGIGPETPVGVCMERSPDLAVALLGTLKAGGIYLPIDPTYPPERRAYMLTDAAVTVLLTQQRLSESFSELLSASQIQIICLDSDYSLIAEEPGTLPAVFLQPEHAAYIVYTSGSTGTPKGVVVSHRALVDRSSAVAARYGHGPQDRLLQFVSISFDVSLEELFPPWLSGATVVLLPEEGIPSLSEVSRLAEEQCLTVLDLPPSYWHEWVVELARTQAPIPGSLRLMIVGSEAVSKVTLANWQQLSGGQIAWCNVYGLSETTLIALTYGPEDNQDWERFPSVPIGRPLNNTQAYVLDEQFQLAPIGVPGELYLGGPALARGYLGRPELTAERFVPNPFGAPGTRLYRTGDLVRSLPGGVLEFLGRVDTQVKVRGYRVELGEIEALLKKYPGVREAVVLAHKEQALSAPMGSDGQKAPSAQSAGEEQVHRVNRLVGYVVTPRRSSAIQARLQRYLEAHLPPYMVPAELVILESLPLTPGGKVDRRVLASQQASRSSRAEAQPGFQTPLEDLLANLWAGVLHCEQISRHDDFFKLGGHSLQATQIVARIREAFGIELPVRALYDAPTIAALSERIEGVRRGLSATPLIPPIRSVARDGALPLSFAQQRLWFLHQLEPDSTSYNMPSATRLHGQLNAAALEQSLNTLLQRHEPLRTTFAVANGQPVQHIAPTATLAWLLIDVSALPEPAVQQAAVQQLAWEETQQLFDLAHGPLIRARLLRLSDEDHLLLLTLHHAVADGWSMDLLFKELSMLYTAYQTGTSPRLPVPAIHYADYALWQRQWLQGEVLEELLAYWRKQLAEAPPVLELPSDYPRPAEMSYRGAHLTFTLPARLSQELRALSQREGVTLFMALLGAFQTLLMRYSGQEDIVVGTPVAGRHQRETEELVGLFVNTLVLRTDLSGNPTFRQVLRRVREVCLGAYEHQDLPFEKLVETLQPERSLSYSPLFQVIFALEHASAEQINLPGLTLQRVERAGDTSKFDLSMFLSETPAGLVGVIEYATDLFKAETIARLRGHWERLLEEVVAHPDQPIAELMLLTEEERQQALAEWAATQTAYPQHANIHQLFETWAEDTPDAIAVVFEEQQLTYAELNRRANQLAHYLRSLGIGPEIAVGLCVERSLDLVIALLGILKAGGIYVPLDPSYPQERLAFMLTDARVPVLLTQAHLQAQLPPTSARLICLESEWPQIARQPSDTPINRAVAANLAYVNYTSGSTGQPKGVCIPHQAVIRLVKATSYATFTASEVFLQFAPVSFDAATFELWGALLNGARLVVLAPTTPSLEDLGRALERYHITTLWLTAGLFHLMVEEQLSSFRYLHQLLAGGDVLSAPHVRRVLQQQQRLVLINGYGPTEGTTFTCCYPMTTPEQVGHTVPIGKPIANTQTYVLDKHLQPVPIGVPGELYIGGDGLARGYLQRPDLTAERFVPHPFSTFPGDRLYKTGDLVRYLPDGNVEFLGRLDHQVKIHGYRIEPGEIESVLSQHPAIRECLVIARKEGPGATRLIAYITRTEQVPPISEVRSYLKERLPEYMLPGSIIELEGFPLNANGKVDRSALPPPAAIQPEETEQYVAPRTPQEEILANIWAQVLRLERVGVHANFFESGGDSILSMQIIARARQAGLQLTPKQLFQYQTIAELAAVATVAPSTAGDDGPVSGPVPLTPIQRWFFEQDLPEPHHYNQAMLLEGPANLHPALLERTLAHLLNHHDALRLRFSRTTAGWKQHNAAPANVAPVAPANAGPGEQAGGYFSQIDLSALTTQQQQQTIEAAAAAFQTSLNLEQGPLLRAALFSLGAQTPCRLLLVIHHLAVDRVSWGILLEDLEAAYEQLQRGDTVQLPAKTTSFQRWAERLTGYAQSPTLLREADYWLAETRRRGHRLPVDHAASPELNTEGAARTVVVTLSAPETQALLQEVPKAYHTQINDVLLAALMTAFREWTGASTLLVDLEGHGREPIVDGVDLSRTVGWFTTIFPVLLDVEGIHGPGEMLSTIKEQLRQIPQHGIGYGLLRYLSEDQKIAGQLQALPQAEISFNYLGQFDQGASESLRFRPAREASGPGLSLRGKRRHLLELLGGVAGEQLRLTWVYSPHVHKRATIERLAQRAMEALRELIRHCLSPEAGGHTPSDFPLAKLDARTLSKLSLLIDEDESR